MSGANTVLRGHLPDAAGTPRVVLRAQPAAVPARPAASADPPQAGRWITEQELEALQRRWTDEAHAQGREQGQRETRDAARRQAEADAQAQLERELKTRDEKHAKDQAEKWRSLATALAGQLQSLREQLEGEVSEWTFIAATRLMGERSRDGVVSAVKQVLADARLDGPATVLLQAQDLALLAAAQAADPAAWPAGVAFAASDRLPLGGCLVQSPAQTLDARLEVQLELLRAALDRARHEPPSA